MLQSRSHFRILPPNIAGRMQANKTFRWQILTTAQLRQRSTECYESRGCRSRVNLRQYASLGKRGGLSQLVSGYTLGGLGKSALAACSRPEALAQRERDNDLELKRGPELKLRLRPVVNAQ